MPSLQGNLINNNTSLKDMELLGKIKEGTNNAHETINKQKELFEKEGLIDTSELYDGTINLDIGPSTYEIVNTHYTFWGVKWCEHRCGCETFGFVKLESLTYNGKKYDSPGYVYFASHSSHLNEKNILELWCKKINNISHGEPLSITIEGGNIDIKQ